MSYEAFIANRKKVVIALQNMIDRGAVIPRTRICINAGVSTSYFSINPIMRDLYDKAVKAIAGESSTFAEDARKALKAKPATGSVDQTEIANPTFKLSKQLLIKLRSRDIEVRSEAIGEVATALGNGTRSKDWNRTIAWLDQNYPGWRGYPNPTVGNSNLLEVVA